MGASNMKKFQVRSYYNVFKIIDKDLFFLWPNLSPTTRSSFDTHET